MSEKKKAIMEFLKKNQKPSDDEFHSWAGSKGMNKHRAEEGVYSMMGNLAGKGESRGDVPPDTDPEELKEGTKVEKEHTPDKPVARKIALDHLKEHKKYYSGLKGMEKGMEAMEKGASFDAFIDELAKLGLALGNLGGAHKLTMGKSMAGAGKRRGWVGDGSLSTYAGPGASARHTRKAKAIPKVTPLSKTGAVRAFGQAIAKMKKPRIPIKKVTPGLSAAGKAYVQNARTPGPRPSFTPKPSTPKAKVMAQALTPPSLSRSIPRTGNVGAAPADKLRPQLARDLRAARDLKAATGVGSPRRVLMQKRQQYAKP